MQDKGEIDHVKVDPMVLRNAGNVLFDVANVVRQVDVDTQADMLPAATAFDGWRTGKSLAALAGFWQREFVADTERIAKLGNSTMAAASNYTAADQASAETMPPDTTYFRGR